METAGRIQMDSVFVMATNAQVNYFTFKIYGYPSKGDHSVLEIFVSHFRDGFF